MTFQGDEAKREEEKRRVLSSCRSLMDRTELCLDGDASWQDEWQIQREQVREMRESMEQIQAWLVTSSVNDLRNLGRVLETKLEEKKLWERHETFKDSWMEIQDDMAEAWEWISKELMRSDARDEEV